ncbi:uncharacterized protein AB9X84_020987, partial [Acanthopagrus schlegelii]
QHTLSTPSSSLQLLPHLQTAASKQPQSGGLRHGPRTSPPLLSDSELDVSSLSSLELCIPPPPLFSSHSHRPNRTRTTAVGVTTSPHHAGHRSPTAARKHSPTRCSRDRHIRPHRTQTATHPKSILKQPASLGVEHAYDIIRKSKSVELLDDSRGRGSSVRHPPTRSLDRSEQRVAASRRSSEPPSPSRTSWNWKMQALQEKVRFSNFLDEITSRVMSPANLTLLGRTPSKEQGSPAPQRRRSTHRKQKTEAPSTDRTRRWDDWLASMQRSASWYQPLEGEGPKSDIIEGARPKEEVLGGNRGVKMEVLETKEPPRRKHRLPVSNQSLLKHVKVRPLNSSSFKLLPHILLLL